VNLLRSSERKVEPLIKRTAVAHLRGFRLDFREIVGVSTDRKWYTRLPEKTEKSGKISLPQSVDAVFRDFPIVMTHLFFQPEFLGFFFRVNG
jgi:hypothetical protein